MIEVEGRTTDAPQVSWKTSPQVLAPTGTRTHAVRGRVVTNQRFRPLDHGHPACYLYAVRCDGVVVYLTSVFIPGMYAI